jgi:tripartite-type tricarboxylate transporter receptor subunit TctC
MAKFGAETDSKTPEEYFAFIEEEVGQWTTLLKEIGYKQQ